MWSQVRHLDHESQFLHLLSGVIILGGVAGWKLRLRVLVLMLRRDSSNRAGFSNPLSPSLIPSLVVRGERWWFPLTWLGNMADWWTPAHLGSQRKNRSRLWVMISATSLGAHVVCISSFGARTRIRRVWYLRQLWKILRDAKTHKN
jgi:hypothetical protein